MYIIDTSTGDKIETTITRLEANEFLQIKNSKRFSFDWSKEKSFEVFKLKGKGINDALGLVSLSILHESYAIEIRLLAVSKENIGKDKKYERITGCLIAFACRRAFTEDFNGYVCLVPKTKLRVHYKKIYGMTSTSLYMITEGANSSKLIEEYL